MVPWTVGWAFLLEEAVWVPGSVQQYLCLGNQGLAASLSKMRLLAPGGTGVSPDNTSVPSGALGQQEPTSFPLISIQHWGGILTFYCSLKKTK